MTVDRHIAHDELATEELLQGADDKVEHEVAIERRIILRPSQALDIFIEFHRSGGKPRQVAIGQVALFALRDPPRGRDGNLADRVAHVATARMQHYPDRVFLVEAELDEMIAATERAELAPHTRGVVLAYAVHDAQRGVTLPQAGNSASQQVRAG